MPRRSIERPWTSDEDGTNLYADGYRVHLKLGQYVLRREGTDADIPLGVDYGNGLARNRTQALLKAETIMRRLATEAAR